MIYRIGFRFEPGVERMGGRVNEGGVWMNRRNEMSEHEAYANGLREIAGWIEGHPEIALPTGVLSNYALNTKEEAKALLSALKPCSKDYTDEMFYIRRKFGAVTLSFAFYRKEVCIRRKVGEKIVPKQEIPERLVPARVVDEHVEDVYEWDCTKPLLELPEEMEAEHESV